MRPCLILFSSSLFLASLQLQLQMFIANHEGNDKHYIKQYLGGNECTVSVSVHVCVLKLKPKFGKWYYLYHRVQWVLL